MGNSTALTDLMCLTISDICATNESLWNDWKRSLFTQLYQFTIEELEKRLDYQRVSQQNRLDALELMKFALSPLERTRLQDFGRLALIVTFYVIRQSSWFGMRWAI
ncbi:PII uridylyl-transferase [Actinobacillus equuli]|nr:PII uridylyl-transferase [Actinobacillus equuli]